jgi:hypothetical protein
VLASELPLAAVPTVAVFLVIALDPHPATVQLLPNKFDLPSDWRVAAWSDAVVLAGFKKAAVRIAQSL